MDKNLNVRLPDGTMFDFWERTISAAARVAAPGTRVRFAPTARCQLKLPGPFTDICKEWKKTNCYLHATEGFQRALRKSDSPVGSCRRQSDERC